MVARFTAKSVVFDIADNYGGADAIGVRSIEFYDGAGLVAVSSGNCTAYNSSQYGPQYHASYAFYTGLSKIDSAQVSTCWKSGYQHTSNERIVVVFDTDINFTSIVINNYHDNGGVTSQGASGVKVTITSDAYSTTTYGASVTGGRVLFDSTISEHIASNAVDDQTLDLLTNDVEFDIPIYTNEGFAWPGDAVLVANDFVGTPWPTLTVSGEAAYWRGIQIEIPQLTPSLEATFVPITVDFEFTIPALTFELSATANKIHMALDLTELTAEMHRGGVAEFALPDLSITGAVLADKVASLGVSLPEILFEGHTGARAKFSLPEITAEMFTGARFGMSLPSLDMEFVAQATRPSTVGFTMPKIAFLAHAGGAVAFSLPEIDASISGMVNPVANLSTVIPALRCTGVARIDARGDIEHALPAILSSMTAKAHPVGSMSFTLPPNNMFGSVIHGCDADLSFLLEQLIVEMEGGAAFTGDILMTLPQLISGTHAENIFGSELINDAILRHVRNKVR